MSIASLETSEFAASGVTKIPNYNKEYVTPADFTVGYNKTLPVENDDLSAQGGSEVYTAMRNDPEIMKCLTVMVIGTLGDGHELLPRYPEKINPSAEEKQKHETSMEVRDFMEANFEGMRRPLRPILEDMLMGAITYGNKVGEKIWKIPETGPYAGKLMIDTIKTKNRMNLRFVVDKFLNVLGFVNANFFVDPYINPAIGAAGLVPLNKFTIGDSIFGATLNGAPVIPREKFAVLALRVEDEDPRGRSFFRAAFNSWHLKRETFPQYLRYLLLTALPLLIGILPENEGGRELARDLEGNYLQDATGNYIETSPTEALAGELMKLRDGSAMAAKGGTTIKLVEAKGDGSAFYKAFEMFDKQMEMSLLLQTLATSDAKFGTRAQATTHMTVLDQLIWWLKNCVVDMVTNDIMRDVVRYNYGDDMLEYTPIIHFGDTERRDFAKDGQTIAALMRAGFWDASQLKALDAQLGAPIRDVSADDLKKQMDMMMLAAQPNNATSLPNGAVSNPAPRGAKTNVKFPKSGRPAA